MLTCIKGGRVIDPANDRDEVADIWLRDGRIIGGATHAEADEIHDATGKIVMAGGIDIHSHIASDNVNRARLLLPEFRARATEDLTMPPLQAPPAAVETGRLYAQMGFTTVVEPAVAPDAALHAHLELLDIPIIDKAILTVLGNDDFLLNLLREGESSAMIADYVAWMLGSSRALGIKVINPGGSAAFRANAREFSLDDVVPYFGVSSRQIVKALQRAIAEIGVPHPVHLHCNNLGLPGNVETALATIEAAEGQKLHLAHLQFYAYGKEGARGFSSSAARLAEAINAARNLTIDVGQVMFGQTVTISSDVLRQFNSRTQAHPRKWMIAESDGNGGGIVPYNYRPKNFYNAVQWAAGLELFLLIADPSRVFFTTDHPNGAPFTTYPDLVGLLMSRDMRAEWISKLPLDAREVTTLASINREYSLGEIATMTRSAPAKLLGLSDRGHLGSGATADIAVYAPDSNPAEMFRRAALVFKDGELVVRNGEITAWRHGRAFCVEPKHDPNIDRHLQKYYADRHVLTPDFMRVSEAALGSGAAFQAVPCAA